MKIIAHDIRKSFGDKLVLDDIGFVAEGGKAFGLLGRNGAGKTTTIRILMKVFPSDSGSIEYISDSDKPMTFGYLPEERGLYPKHKICDQLVYLGELKGMTKANANERMLYLLDKLQMTEYKDKKLETLSKGNQQKIQLIATLINNPDVVILDEPFSGLDPVNAMVLKNLVTEIIESGKIVFFSSHQMNYVEEFCQDIAILQHGKIAVSGAINDIKRSYPRDQIVISGKDVKLINEFTKSLDYVLSVVEEKDDKILVKLADAADKSKLLSAINDKGYDLDEFRVYEPSLNDIFVKYTEDVQ